MSRLRRFSWIGRHRNWLRTLPFLLLAISLCGTWGAWRLIKTTARLKAQSVYNAKTAGVVASIVDELHDYEQLLGGGVALFSVQQNITPEDWRRYVSALEPKLRPLGLPSIDYASYFIPTDRSDLPLGRRQGFKLASDPVTRAAMNQALDTGETTITGALPSGSQDSSRRGFLILSPVYHRGMPVGDVASRRTAIQGFVYSRLDMTVFLHGALGSLPVDIGFQVFDGESVRPAALTWTSLTPQVANLVPTFSDTRKVRFYGRTWTFLFTTQPPFDRELEQPNSGIILGSGIAIGSLLFLVAFAVVSTGQKAVALAGRMTRELQESENRFRTMADSAAVIIWTTDPSGFFLWANRAWTVFTGRTLQECLGRGWLDTVHPEDRDMFVRENLFSLENCLPFHLEYRMLRADGAYRTMLASGAPRVGDGGFLEGFVGSNLDITELRLANLSVQASEEFGRSTIDALTAHICVLDERGNVLSTNQAWRDFARANPPIPQNYDIGCNYLDVCDDTTGREGEDAAKMAAGIRSVMRREADCYMQEYACHSRSERRFFIARVSRFAGSGPLRIVVAHENITARKLAEEALRESEEQLKSAQRQAHVGSFTRFVAADRMLWSAEMYRILDVDAALPAVSYLHQPEHYTPASFLALDRAMRKAVATGEPFSLDLELVRPDGTPRFCIASCEAILDENQQVARLQGTYHDVTELQSLSRELQRSHDLLASLSRQIPGFIYQYRLFPDGHGCCPYASDGIKQLLNLTPDEVREDASKIFAAIDPDDYDGAVASIQDSARTLRPWRHEWRFRTPQGVRWSEALAQPQRLEDGSVLWHGYLTDITERKLMEAELKLARFTVDNLQDAVYWIQPGGQLWNVNGAACRMLGYTHEEMTGRSVFDLDPYFTMDMWNEAWLELKRSGTVRLQTLHRRKDGRETPVEITAHYLNFNGMEYDWAVARDITGQIHTERAIERRQRAILDNLPMLAWMKDAHGCFEMVNEAFAEYCGLPAAEIVGKTAIEVMSPDAACEYRSVNEKALATGRQTRAEIALSTPQGTVWRLVHAMPLFDEHGEVVGTTGISQDISERKCYEQELLRAREAADLATRAQSGFLANMSHEIRTPLNGILGMNQVLMDSALDPRQRRCVEVVGESAKSLLEVLNDILDWSKIDAGKLVLEKVDFDLRALVENITDLFAARAQEKGLEMTCFIAPDVLTALRGDPVRLRQVLLNLLGNAVKFTAEGVVSLRVKLADGGGTIRLRFEVSDTGIGIPEVQHHLLFQPFSQADSSTTRHFGGTGLGLSIVQRLVGLMNGQVSFNSREGQGSTFWFTAEFDPQPGVVRPRPLSLAGNRVLVVDGNANSRRFVCDLLTLWSCDFEAAVELGEAVKFHRARADSKRFEAVIIDTGAVDIGSGDVLSQLRTAGLTDMAVVELVPLARMTDPVDASDPPMVTRIAKPVKQGELGRCLATVLGYGPAPVAAADRRRTPLLRRMAVHREARILLVEDNGTNQEVATAILGTLGYRNVVVARDGLKALKALSEEDFDLVLMDCQMPEMDGYEATRQIRQPLTPVRNHQIPILAMTANVMEADRRKCLEAGMDDYIAKPIERDVLAQTLDRWLKERRAGAPATCASPVPGASTGSIATKCVASPVGSSFASGAKGDAEIFDREGLLSRVMGNTRLAHRVVARFLLDMPQQLLALSAALGNQDSKAARLAAHSIKGAAANVGGVQLRQAAHALEALGESGNLDEAGRLLPSFQEDWERFRAETESFVGQGSGGAENRAQ